MERGSRGARGPLGQRRAILKASRRKLNMAAVQGLMPFQNSRMQCAFLGLWPSQQAGWAFSQSPCEGSDSKNPP